MGNCRGGYNLQQGPRFADAVAMIRESKPGIVLLVDTAPRGVMEEIRSWGGLNIARRYWPHGTEWNSLCSDGPEATAMMVYNGWIERFGNVRELVDYAVGANEFIGSDKPEQWQQRLAYEFERSLAAKFRSVGVKYAAFSLPPGNIEPWMWAEIMEWCKQDGLDFVGDALCVHSYWRSTAGPCSRDSYDPQAPYLIGRECWYEPWPNVTVGDKRVSLPIIIGEYGFDHSLSGQPKTGFTKQYLMPDRDAVYADHLLQGGRLLAQLAEQHKRTYVGWTLFTVGGDDEWVRRGFDATQIWQVRDAIKSLPASHTEYVQPEEVPVYEFTEGFLAYSQEHPEVGKPEGPLSYDEHGNAYQDTSEGMLVWWKDANWIGFGKMGEGLPKPPPEPAPSYIHTMDVSSHQPTDLTALIQENQVEQVIVRLYLPWEQPSQDISRAQIASAKAAGCRVGGYCWLYPDADPMITIAEALSLARECGLDLKYLWIDIEPYEGGPIPSAYNIRRAINLGYLQGKAIGLYTGSWCWTHGDQFADVPLWAAQYDGDPNPDVFTPFGGWTQCAAKQYQGAPIDLSGWRPEYAEALPEQSEEPPVEETDWKAECAKWEQLFRNLEAVNRTLLERISTAEARLAAIRAAGGW